MGAGGGEGVLIFYDDACPLCTAVAGGIRRLDRRGRLCALPMHDPAVRVRYRLDPARADARIQGLLPGGRPVEGWTCLREVVRRLPGLWPLRPLTALVDRLGLGEALYDALAAHRPRRPAAPAGAPPLR